MRVGVTLLVVLLLVCSSLCVVTTRNQYILVDGQPFFMTGATYSIIPTGKIPDSAPDSAANTTYGRGIWMRDINNMKAIGGNTLRVYSMESADHTAFYDYAYANGIKLIVSMWVTYQNFSDPTIRSNLLSSWTAFVKKERHPAILMWCFGNELNIGGNGDGPLFNIMKDVRNVVQTYDTPNPRPVTTTFADRDLSSTISTFYSQSSGFDVFSFQIYRGNTFYNLFKDFNATVKLQKPLLITEFGCDAFDNNNNREDQTQHANWNMKLWNEIYSNSAICAGGLSFNYADEWWRCDKTRPSVHKNCGNTASASFDNYWNEEWSGLYSVAPNPTSGGPDILTPRSIVTNLTKLWSNSPYPKDILTTIPPKPTPTSSSSYITCNSMLLVMLMIVWFMAM
ncbi:beta-glucuronidase [Acrasis kona]|uniref:Beta-glucuronidase n=1 Tax=Acrasis kona TaxID=1008807 RepID=A0AAW2YRC7_9EUKA